MPLPYEKKIAAIPGVKDVTSLRWFGGTYKDARDPRNNFAQSGIEPTHLFDVYPEFSMPQEEIVAFEWQKTACICRVSSRTGERGSVLRWYQSEQKRT